MLSKLYNWLVLSYNGKKTSEKIFLFVVQIAALAITSLSLIAILNILFS